MGQQPGSTQHNIFGQYNNLYPSPGILTVSPFPDKREVILREIEKERIRAQQIVSEIAKMHVLEGEINKDPSQVEAAKLTVSELKPVTQNHKPGNLNHDQERTIQSVQKNAEPKKATCNIWCEICQVGTSTGTFMNNHEKGKKHLRRLKKIVQKGETGEGNQKANIEVLLDSVEHVSENGKSLLSRNFDVVMDEAMLELRKPVDVSSSGFETLPVQIRSEDRRVSGVTPLTKNSNEEEKIIFVDNQDATIFGLKLKAVTLPIADSGECSSGIVVHKKSDGEQSNGDSQINVTSESVLNEHLHEKKQRLSDVSSKPRSPGKNCIVDTILEKTELPYNPKPEKDQAKTLQSVQKNPDPKSTMHKFWCQMCQVGAHSEIVMNNHEKGKKHVKRLKNRAQNGEPGPSNQNEKMEVSLTCDQHFSENGKNIISVNVDAFEKGGHKFVFESKAKEEERDVEVTGQGVDMIEREVDLTIDAVLPGEDDITAKGNWSSGICQLFAVTVTALNEFLLGRNQKVKEASLKTPPSGRDSGLRNIAADTTLPKETEPLANSKLCQLKALTQKNDGPKRTTDGFFHKKCQLGPLCKKNTNDFEEEIVQNGESGPCIEKEKTEEPVNCDEHISEDDKILPWNNDDVVSAEARLELENTMDTSDDGFEAFLIQIGAVDPGFSDVKTVLRNVKEEEIVQNADYEPCIEKKIEEPVNYDNHKYEGAALLSNNVDVVSIEARVELEKPSDTSNIGFETSLIHFGTVDLRVSEDKPITKEDEIVQNSESEPCVEKEKIEEPMNGDKHISECGKGVLLNNAGEISTESRLKLLDTADNGSETSLIQFRIVDLKVSNVKPIEENDNKEESILVVNPDADSIKCPSDIILYKNLEGVQSCVESSLTEQLSRKTHKLEEASLISQSPGKKSNIGKLSCDTLLMKKTGLLENPKSDNFKNDPGVQKKGDPKKNKDNFWCKKRRIRTSSGNVIDEEKAGKDANHLKDIPQNSETKMCNQRENIEVSVNYDAHKGQRNIISDDVDVVCGEARLEHKHLNASDNGFETLSIQIEAVDLHVPEVKPIMRNDKKEEIIFVANPDANISGSKCKTVTPTALKDMFEKKHKLKEDLLKPQSPGKHCGIGKFPCDPLLSTETELLVNLKSDNYKKDRVKTIQSVQKNGDTKMTKDVFWREMNQVGTSSDKVVHDKEKGRKHNEFVRNGETEPCDLKEKINEHLNRVKHISEVGKFIFPHILAKQDAKATGVDITKSGHGSTLHAFLPKDGEINVQGKWNCALCQVIAPNESSLNEHLCGKKHKLKEALLKTLHASLPKDGEINAQGEWNCALCQVIPNESSMNEHLCGKKHKLKEPSLKTRRPGNDSSMRNVATITLLEYSKSDNTKNDNAETNSSVGQSGDLKKTINSWCDGRQVGPSEKVTYNLEKDKESAEIDECKTSNLKEKMEVSVDCVEHVSKDHVKTIQSIQKNGDPKITKDVFCREKNQVGTSSDIVVHDEEKRRKRKEIVQNGERCDHKEKIDEHLNHVKHISEVGKFIFPHILAKQDAKTGVDITKSGHGSTLHAFLPKDGEINVQGKWNCALCQVIAPNESSLNEHLCGKKHKLKEALLKTLHASLPKDGEINAQGEWNCALCQVIPNESSMNEHLCGKKHKLKEPSLKTRRPGNDSSMRNVATITLLEYSKSDNTKNDNAETNSSVGQSGDLKKTINSWCDGRQVGPSEKVTYNLEKDKESAEIDECKTSNLKEKMEVSVDCVEHVSKDHVKTIQSIQKNGDPKITKDVFCREKNQVGTSSDIVVHDEEKRRKRKEIVQNGERCDHKEKIDEHLNHVKHISEVGKFIFPHILAKQDAKTGVDITKSGHGSTLHAFSPKDGEINVQGKWNCALCQVIAPNASSLNEHLCGKKHKLKEASLKTLHAFLPNDGEINAQGEPNCVLHQVISPSKSSPNEHLCGKKHKLKEASLKTRHAFLPKDGEISAQGEWNCALCQVIAPTESSLNVHLRGKKHKLKEASLKTPRPGKDSNMTNVETVTLLEYSKSNNTIKDNVETNSSVGQSGDLKKTINSWCDGRQVGLKVTYNLEKAKETAEIDERKPSNLKEKMEVSADCVEHVSKREKSIVTEMFGQFIAKNQSPLNDHKLKEASLKTQRPGNNFSVENTLLEYPKSDNMKEDSAKTIRSAGKNGDFKKTKHSYWRRSCQVGPSEEVTYNLEKGNRSAENDKYGAYNEKEKMEVPVNCVVRVSESEKFTGVVCDQARLELPKPLDATKNGGHKRVVKQNEKRWQIKNIKD